MSTWDPEEQIREGVEAIEKGDTLKGLLQFECASNLRGFPIVQSYLAFCIAKERHQIKEAIAMCQQALDKETNNTAHYLNFGRVLLLAGKKRNAIAVFQRGLKQGVDRRIVKELKKLGRRRDVAVPALPREHPVNKYLGIALARIRPRPRTDRGRD